MEWMEMLVFSVVFWATYHCTCGMRDYRKETALYRALRDIDRANKKLDDSIRRVK
jgi:hypothetical protein